VRDFSRIDLDLSSLFGLLFPSGRCEEAHAAEENDVATRGMALRPAACTALRPAACTALQGTRGSRHGVTQHDGGKDRGGACE